MTQPTGRARGIDRVIDILDYLHQRRGPVRIADIARDTGTPRSTIYEIVNRLVEAHWLEPRDGDGTVFFGPAMHFYGNAYLEGGDRIRAARAEVKRLVELTGETAQYCALEGDKYTVVLNEPGRRTFRISSDVGVRVPIPWTASGRLLVGHLSLPEVTAFIPPEDFTLPDGRRIAPADFVAEVAQAGNAGYARTTGLVDRFTTCLAAPVRDASGRCVATVCLVVPADTSEASLAEMIAALQASGRKLSLA